MYHVFRQNKCDTNNMTNKDRLGLGCSSFQSMKNILFYYADTNCPQLESLPRIDNLFFDLYVVAELETRRNLFHKNLEAGGKPMLSLFHVLTRTSARLGVILSISIIALYSFIGISCELGYNLRDRVLGIEKQVKFHSLQIWTFEPLSRRCITVIIEIPSNVEHSDTK